MENERETKFQKLMADKAFVEGLAQQVQPEDAQAYFAANGVDFTLEEIKALGKAISLRAKQQRGEELTEDELAEVSGGAGVFATLATFFCGLIGVAGLGVGVAYGLAALMGVAFAW